MNRRHTPLSLAAMLLLGLLMLAPVACKKQPFINTVQQTLYLGLPTGVDRIFSVDMERVRMTDSFNEAISQMKNDPKSQVKQKLDEIQQKVGFDPLNDINMLVISGRGPGNAKDPMADTVMVARGNFKDGPAKVEKLRDWLGDELLTDIKSSTGQHPGGARTVKITGKSQFDVNKVYELNFGFPSETLMVFSLSGQLMNDTLDVIAGQVEGLRKDQGWMETLKRPNIGATVWGVGNVPPSALKQLAGAGGPMAEQARAVRQFFFDFNFTPDFVTHIGLVCENIESATKLADTLRQGFDKQVKPLATMMLASYKAPETLKMLDRINIQNELEVAKISLTEPADDMRKLSDELERLGQTLQAARGGAAMPPMFPGMPSSTAPVQP